MSEAGQVLDFGRPIKSDRPLEPRRRAYWRDAEFRWAIAFVLPYVAVFLAFVVYPFAYALWLGLRPALYEDLFTDPNYFRTIVNTLLFVGLGVNVKMFLALLLAGFFLRPRWWIRATLVAFVLPWLIAAAQAAISFHWMLIGSPGLVDLLLKALFGIEGPDWLTTRWLALGSDIVAYIWKWLPFWTLIFMAGRLTIARDIYDAAEVDGATGPRRFLHVTWPLLANLYLVCTLLSTLWTIGEFITVYLVSQRGPADASQVLATLGYDFAFDGSQPALGVAVVLSALPVLIPIAIILMRRIAAAEVETP